MVLFAPLKELISRSLSFFVNFLSAAVVFAIGWLVAKFIKSLVVRVLKALRIDSISEQVKLTEFLSKGGIKHTLSEVAGIIVYWILMVGVLISSLNLLALTGVSALLNRILGYVPGILGAVIILVVGGLVSTLLSSIVRTATANLGISRSDLLGKITQTGIMLFAVLIALDQLNIARVLISAINIILGAIGLAAALAFGLGCRDIAAKYTEEVIDKIKSKK